jgi:SOS-response transcriptional repressor LexA
MIPPTKEQKRALDVIRKLIADDGAPSYGEISAALGYTSRSATHRIIHELRHRGLIDFEDRRARSIRIIGDLEGLQSRSTHDLRALRTTIDTILRERLS